MVITDFNRSVKLYIYYISLRLIRGFIPYFAPKTTDQPKCGIYGYIPF